MVFLESIVAYNMERLVKKTSFFTLIGFIIIPLDLIYIIYNIVNL